MQTQMHCGFVVRFAIWLCLVRLTAGGECVPEECGSTNVSFPFWISNSHCGFPGFQVKCMKDTSTGEMARFLQASQITRGNLFPYYYKIMEINYTGSLLINSSLIYAQSCTANLYASETVFQLPPDGPFTISMSNKFVALGCHTSGMYKYEDDKWDDVKCKASCYTQRDPPYCLYGCCEISLRDNYKWLSFTGKGLFNASHDSNLCGFTTIMDTSTFTVVENNTRLFWGDVRKPYYGLRLNWGIGFNNCLTARGNADYSCYTSAECIDSPSDTGYVCKCKPGYQGNGYAKGIGCRDVDECSNHTLNKCVQQSNGGRCHNLEGNYTCSCAKGYTGDGFHTAGTGCVSKKSHNSIIAAILGSVCSFVGVSVGACALVWWLRRHQWKKLRNWAVGEINSSKGENFKEIPEADLQTASHSYSTILGKGSFGTAYEGTLPPPDGRHVAIKEIKSISKELIYEIIILSHISHPNVVQLIGFCMKLESPLLYLVYEIPSSETLFHHLQSTNSQLSWERRLEIAIGSAQAVVYMHDEAPQSNFHRDIKSSNILLEENTFAPRVADFSIMSPPKANTSSESNHPPPTSLDDPQSKKGHQFAHKRNVYSFGVLLVELLTGAKKSLDDFLSASKENRIIDALDDDSKGEGKKSNIGQMEDMAKLAERCLRKEELLRPSMREVEEDLSWIKGGGSSTQRATSNRYRRRGPDETTSSEYYSTPSAAVITLESPSTR